MKMRHAEFALSLLFAGLAAIPAPSLAQGAGQPAATTPANATAAPATASPNAPALPPSKWTEQQIRQAFELADADNNGQLSRAEAQRLPVMPHSFEDIDTNKDGAITLDEFLAAFRS